MNIILQEMKKISITLGVMAVILFPVGIVCGTDWLNMLLSLLFGGLFTLANFMLLGSICDKASRKPPHKAKTYMQMNYIVRLLLTAVVILAAFKLSYLNPIGVIVPLFAPKLTYFAVGIYQSLHPEKEKEKAGGDPFGRTKDII